MTQESGSYVSELLKSRFWNDIPGTAAAEHMGLWGVQCDYQSNVQFFFSPRKKGDLLVFLMDLVQNTAT